MAVFFNLFWYRLLYVGIIETIETQLFEVQIQCLVKDIFILHTLNQ